MPSLHLSDTTYGRIQIEKREGEKLLTCEAAKFVAEKEFRQAAKTLGIDKAFLMQAVDQFQKNGVKEVSLTEERQPLCIWIRSRLGADKVAYDSLEQVLAVPIATLPLEPLICWNDAGQLAALDIDLHDRPRESEGQLLAWIMRAAPVPKWAWTTHGGGLRLVYEAIPPYRADELAAVAAISLSSLIPGATYEIKTSTRHPAVAIDGNTCGEVRSFSPTTDLSVIAGWLKQSEAKPEVIEEWLASRGLQVGKRYTHAHCPEQPEERGEREPVVIYPEGVYCYVCSARGVSRGHRSPGWFPFASLCGGAVSGALQRCLAGFCHWTHARHVLAEHVGLSGSVAELAYHAALKLVYPDDLRLSGVASAGKNFLRFEGRWVTELGETYTKDIRSILAALPACQLSDSTPSAERIARFNQPIDLSEYGYPALTPVWGCRIYSHRLPLSETTIVVPCKPYANDTTYRPRFRKVRDVPDAWKTVEEVFPGVTRSLIELLIAAKGVSEGGVAMPPMIFISGPTSSAKTSSVSLAAAICADHNSAIVWTGNIERVRQSVQDGKDEGSFITFNEILKASSRYGETFTQSLDFLLNLTGDSRSHKLYVGSVRLGSVPVCVWTDTEVPAEVKQDAQLARRLVHVPLSHQVDWRGTMKNSGVGRAERFRLTDRRYADACDVILSDVIDRFFDVPHTFEEIAEALGYQTMERSNESQESTELLKRFYAAWKNAPELEGADARHLDEGWKVIRRDEESEIANLWARLCDAENWSRSRRCTEVEWAKILQLTQPLTFVNRYYGGNKVFVRFQ